MNELRRQRERLRALGTVPIRTGLTVIEETGPSGVRMTHFLSANALQYWQPPRHFHTPQIVTETPAALLYHSPRPSVRREA